MAAQGNDCFYFYNATCYKGARCQYRHCEEAIGSEMVCEDWMNGICFIDDCPYRHAELNVQVLQQPNMANNVPCYYDMQPGGCRNPECQYLHAKQVIQAVPNQPTPSGGFSSLVEIPLVSDVPNDDPNAEPQPHQMSMAYEEPFSIPSVVVSHRLSGEHLVIPQVEPIIINPMEDESSDQESNPTLSPRKNPPQSGPQDDGAKENSEEKRPDNKVLEEPSAEDAGNDQVENAESEEEVEESVEEEEEEEEEETEEEEEEASSEEDKIELFDTEGHEVLENDEETLLDTKSKKDKELSKDEGKAEKKKLKEDTDLSEVLSLEEVMRRKALESMYKRRAEKEKAKQQPEKKKEEIIKKKDDKDDKKRSRRSRSRSRSPYRRRLSPDSRNWRGRRRSPFGRSGRRSPPPFGRRSPPFSRRSPPRRRSPFRRPDRRDPTHRMAVQRLRGQRNQAERDLEELAAEAEKLEKKIRSSAESVKILKQVELKKQKELLRKQLEAVNKELDVEGDDSSSSSSSSSCSCSESDSSSGSSSAQPKKRVASKLHRHQTHKHKNTSVARQNLTSEELRRRRALRMQQLSSSNVDSDGSGQGRKVVGLSLAEIRRRRAIKFGLKHESGSNEVSRKMPTRVAKSSSDEHSSGEGEGSQASGPSELVILKKVEPLRKMNIRKVVTQGAMDSNESLESQAQRELRNKNALKKIQVQRMVRDTSVEETEGISELNEKRQKLLQELKVEDKDVETETGEATQVIRKPAADEDSKLRPKSSIRRVMVVVKEEPKKDSSIGRAATDIVIKSLEDIKKEKREVKDTLRMPEESESSEVPQRRRLNIPRNKSDSNLLKRSAISDEDLEAKRRLIRRNPQQIYIPPAAAKFREIVKMDEPATTAVTLPELKFVDEKVESSKIPMSRLTEQKSSGSSQIIVKTFSEIMKEKRERKQRELEQKRAATASKSEETIPRSNSAFISPITFDVDKGKPKASLSESALPKRKLYSEPEKPQESRMLANWGARRNKTVSKPSETKSNVVRTNVTVKKSMSESAVSTKKMNVFDLPPDDDDLDLEEFEAELREDERQEKKYEPVKKLVQVVKPKDSGDSMERAASAADVSKRKGSSEEKSKPSRHTSTSDALMDEFQLLLEGEEDDVAIEDTELQVQDDDALLMELEEMLA